jgi:hypothetical protein
VKVFIVEAMLGSELGLRNRVESCRVEDILDWDWWCDAA